jgi:iron complex transport system substrate-binding protein
MRIASLLPSATEIAFALGLGEQVVAVSHECDYPLEASKRPILTKSAIHQQTHASHEVDEEVSRRGGDIYAIDEKLLESLKPDLILTQELCSVCAVSYRRVKEAARVLDADTKIVSLEPSNLDDIIDNIRLVGKITGRSSQAEELALQMSQRIDQVREKTQSIQRRPRVAFIEWLRPPWVGGHWIPQMVDYAGGIDGIGIFGQPSRKIEWDEIVEYEPEILILSPCGYDIKQVLAEVHALSAYSGWDKVPAFQYSNIFAVNASAYFSRPGPRIVDGLELLAHVIHPELFPTILTHDRVRRVDPGLFKA